MEQHCLNCDEMERTRPSWGPGPWEGEPNRVEFEHAGFPCILHRGGGGAWCGYAGVPPGHPCHGKGYEDVPDVSVHGGLTYAEPCQGHICHVPKPGEPDNVWWFGWDASHAGDLRPADRELHRKLVLHGYHDVYRDLAYVRQETESLAEQLRKLA